MADGATDNSFLAGSNAVFIAELQRAWAKNPGNVSPEWAAWFASLEDMTNGALAESPSWGSAPSRVIGADAPAEFGVDDDDTPATDDSRQYDSDEIRAATLDSVQAIMLIRAYRIRGHMIARLDPLALHDTPWHSELDPKTYGFTEADWDRPIFINNVLGMETATLREILAAVRKTYCGSIGVEFMHIQDPEQKAWIQARMESDLNRTEFTDRGKIAIYERLIAAENFEQFLHRKYVGTKRFGLDGGEAVVPAIEQILKRGSQLGLKEVVIGMAHRGRLNVLHEVLSKPFRAIISEFLGNPANPIEAGGSGDVKYHMGASADREFDGNEVHLSLSPNPSHLEIIDPVVVGRTRAKQAQRNDEDRHHVMGMLLHGDAAFAGQGIVAETFAFSALRGYRTGGTMHIIVNNQIGFTTDPWFSRSSPYPTDVAKMVMAPIFHVNCDDAEAVVHAARIATEFRQQFKTDVVLDMICYRRFGHNEGDEPAFTQPLMYQKIKDHPTVRKIYGDRLIAEGVLTPERAQALIDADMGDLEKEFEAGTSYRPNKADWLEGRWTGFKKAHGDERRGDTDVTRKDIDAVANALATIPDGFTLNHKLERVIAARTEAIKKGEGIDWATGEILAFGTLILHGKGVRLSGQDCCRGTFSQRHAVYVDQKTNERYAPLHHLEGSKAHCEIIDSPLSEASVLGFEYGYSLAEPNTLVMWEAQFGDFANGAQVVVDQFISSGEAKWLRMSGLVMLLPHGHEGQGPEHSSARLERYLQLCAEDNMQVVNCTTPANHFHCLRRQMMRDFRKPLIAMTPKSLLRHKRCVSRVDDLTDDATFHRVFDETDPQIAKKAKRIVLCSGKVYYDLLEAREKAGIDSVALVRVEQLFPFPRKRLMRIFAANKNAEVIWCQEEPHNMGAWFFVHERIEDAMHEAGAKHERPFYVGRAEAASPATGSLARHLEEQQKLVAEALDLNHHAGSKAAE